jgi:hypothetical protein
LVDDFEPRSGGLAITNGAVPNDAELDGFWQDMLEDVAGFDFAEDAITAKAGDPISIVKFASYKSVIWDVYAAYNTSPTARPKLYDMIRFKSKDPSKSQSTGKIQPNLLALFVRAGGHLLLCGQQPMTQAINTEGFFDLAERYPFIFKYELEGDQDGDYSDQIQVNNPVGDKSFPYLDACVNVIDIAYGGFSELRTRVENGCGVNTIRQINQQQEGFREAFPLDASFPTLTLRNEVAGPGRAYAPSVKGLNSEMYNPPYFASCAQAQLDPVRDCFEPVYGHVCLNTASPLYHAPVAFWSSSYADVQPSADDGVKARSFYMGVEPFYFVPTEAKQMLDLILFGEWQLPRI